MHLTLRNALLSFAFLTLAGIATAGEPKVELLWANGAPAAKGTEDKDKPTLTIYLPEKQANPTTAVVICPGGGYGFLAFDHEGHQIAKWLSSNGIAGIILKYRLPAEGYKHPVPLQDAQRAIRMVRTKAKDWNIDSARIGILGFSAGGHLASTAGTHFDSGNESAADPVDRASCRPDFMALIYPVVTFKEFTHTGSRNNLIGENADPALIDNLSNELQVTAKTPQTFLIHSNDDPHVPPENSINFYLALRKAKVPAEMHIYEKGGHGFGMGRPNTASMTWLSRMKEWMQDRGITNKK